MRAAVALSLLSWSLLSQNAAAQQLPAAGQPVSLTRIRAGIEDPAEHPLKASAASEPATPRFRTSVEERTYMLTFEEYLHKQLELTPMQRQSQEWASKCCGLDLDVVFKPIERALQRRKERKLREQIARELEELQAAREK